MPGGCQPLSLLGLPASCVFRASAREPWLPDYEMRVPEGAATTEGAAAPPPPPGHCQQPPKARVFAHWRCGCRPQCPHLTSTSCQRCVGRSLLTHLPANPPSPPKLVCAPSLLSAPLPSTMPKGDPPPSRPLSIG